MGRQLRDENGIECPLLPMPNLYIIQTSYADSWTHCCGTPIDINGDPSQAVYPFYAPFSFVMYNGSWDPNTNCRMFYNTEPVHLPTGEIAPAGTVYFQCGHMSDGYYPATSGQQGDICYYSGLKGAMGTTHVHMEFGRGTPSTPTYQGVCYQSGVGCYAFSGDVPIDRICFADGTNVSYAGWLPVSTHFNFIHYGEEPTPVDPDNPDDPSRPKKRKKMPLWMMMRKRKRL